MKWIFVLFFIIIFSMLTVYGCEETCGGNLLIAGCSSGSSSVTAATISKKIFVSNAYSPSMGGVAGGDTACMSDANKPADTSTYKAMIVDGTTRVASVSANAGDGQVGWVLQANANYYRTDGSTLIGVTGSNSLFTFPLQSSISIGGVNVMTGLSTTWQTGANTCSSWNNTLGNVDVGLDSDTASTAINTGVPWSCTGAYPMYCVEQ